VTLSAVVADGGDQPSATTAKIKTTSHTEFLTRPFHRALPHSGRRSV